MDLFENEIEVFNSSLMEIPVFIVPRDNKELLLNIKANGTSMHKVLMQEG